MGYGCFFNDEIWSLFQRLGYVFPVRNVVSNKHTKFEQDQSIFTSLNLGGTQKLPKFMGRGEIFFPKFKIRRMDPPGECCKE